MKEKELINIIKNLLNSEYIGDDCAYLKDLEIVVSQDSLVEGVHFLLDGVSDGWRSGDIEVRQDNNGKLKVENGELFYIDAKMHRGIEAKSFNNNGYASMHTSIYASDKNPPTSQPSKTISSTFQPFNPSTDTNQVGYDVSYQYAYSLGWKTVMVNISDICASGAEPKYLTISLSIPEYIDEKFVEEFYKGAKGACGAVKIVGGDITGSDKLYISATAIGSTKNRKISSRSNAKIGYKIIVSGEHGNSAKGLEILSEGWVSGGIEVLQFNNSDIGEITQKQQTDNSYSSIPPYLYSSNTSLPSYHPNFQPSDMVLSPLISKFLQSHLMPIAKRDFSKQIASNCKQDYAMMDTSDGLGDALMQIAKSSNVRLKIDTSKIPHDKFVDMETVLYGGEDYELVAVVPKDLFVDGATEIGEVIEGDCGLEVDEVFYTDIEDKLFNHFERNK